MYSKPPRRNYLGTFQCLSGTFAVLDPCYSKETAGGDLLSNVRTGEWKAYQEHASCPSSALYVVHESMAVLGYEKSASECASRMTHASFTVDVDSGQAGIWDLPACGYGEGDSDEPASFYGKCCAVTCDGRGAGVMDRGAVSSTAYGDGGYNCRYLKDKDGLIVAVRIDFSGDDDSKEDTSDCTSDWDKDD